LMLVLIAAVGFGWLTWPFWQLSIGLGADGPEPPSRLYGRPHVLSVGEALDSAQLGGELEELGYSRVGRRTPLPGEFDRTATRLRTVLRAHPTVTGMAPEGGLEVGFQSGPPLVASYFGPDRQERRPVTLERVPEHLIRSVLAAEDARFFEHPGLSMRGILRAALVNLRGREVRQGGSTLTQQLAKNLFLTHERTLVRKVREVLLALLLELRFEKREILEAYLNEIYWGSSGSVQIMGAGAASWAYFGKEVDRLDLCESATLAGMIRSPGGYSPTARPERSRERRNWVLARLVDLGWVEREAAETEAQRPPCSSPRNLGKRLAPYFADAMRAEAERRFGVDPQRERALVLLSTLDLADQKAADSAVAWGLEALEQGWEKGHEVKGPLQVALLSLEPSTGEIRAWIGGRDYGKSQFDRVTLAPDGRPEALSSRSSMRLHSRTASPPLRPCWRTRR